MKSVSPATIEIIAQLQSIPSLSEFALGGGTNLAYQFNHRTSDDIDLFYPNIVGKSGFKKIENDVKSFFGKKARNLMTLAILATNFVLFDFLLI